jgi:hypothetical protein
MDSQDEPFPTTDTSIQGDPDDILTTRAEAVSEARAHAAGA